jgi:hypothetical protein
MLNSGKKIRDKEKTILTCVVKKKISERKKKGGGGGGMVLCFVQKNFFGQHKS